MEKQTNELLSGWLKKNYPAAYDDAFKHQKFLFFYELFSKSLNKECEFKGLKGCKNDSAFSNILEERYNRRNNFDNPSEQNNKIINKDIAMIAGFLVSSLSKEELSEEAFSEDNRKLSGELLSMYPVEVIKSSEIIECNDKYFVFSKSDYKNLTGNHYDVLGKISKQDGLENPVFAELDKDGRICVS